MPDKMPDAASTVRWLTCQQVADHFGVSARTVHNWIADDKLPSRKFGRGRRISWVTVREVERTGL